MNKSNNNTNLDDSKTNGLITKIWGPHFWETLHCVSFGYPLEPTEEHKKDYRQFFTSVKDVLPCKYCRESYTVFIFSEDETKLTDNDLKNRDNLTRWVYKLHTRVNIKIGMEYNVSYEDIVKRYESYRAVCVPKAKSCSMPLNLKANSYSMAEIRQAPVIRTDFFNCIKVYAEKRGVKFSESIKKLLKLRRDDEAWLERDKYCWILIKKMRKNAIPCVESDGEYKNLPTIEELKLMSMLSTNICCDELNTICTNIKKLDL
jgi:hypothetical protein